MEIEEEGHAKVTGNSMAIGVGYIEQAFEGSKMKEGIVSSVSEGERRGNEA